MLARNHFIEAKGKNFDEDLSQNILNIEEKTRSNIFAWRGQFSPQLIENLLLSYCPKNAVVLDPFVGSGTVLYESACFGLQAFGYELNPAAWILSRTYELVNLKQVYRKKLIEEIANKFYKYFPESDIFEPLGSLSIEDNHFRESISSIYSELKDLENIVLDAFVILLDLANNKPTRNYLHTTFIKLSKIIENLPYSEKPLKVCMSDARCLPLDDKEIDFVITSPPYMNVFNYHQNYRRSAELLGWNLLEIARSEIGSNRANRGNRFLTVIQYCLDMADVLRELHRVCKKDARIIFVVGHESNVLNVPFFNADIIKEISIKSGCFNLALQQRRNFKNKFGSDIREDLLHLSNLDCFLPSAEWDKIARDVALKVLSAGLTNVAYKNKKFLEIAIEKVSDVGKTPLYNNKIVDHYRQPIEVSNYDAKEIMPELSKPHFTKLTACLDNPRLPSVDRERVKEALNKYYQWIKELESIERGQPYTVEKLVEATNKYKRFIELDLIFDSPDNFLYRQKGQLKLDNTILEEFIPQLIFRSLRGLDNSFELGPRQTFAGLSFLSSLGKPGEGREPTLRAKDQDFILGKKLYLKTSFDSQFKSYQLVQSHLGYVCAECKTNLDKTMFQEAVATSRDLKIAVPGSLYFLVCEFLDMTPISIVSTQIDDVLIVRKSKRMSSSVRQEYRTPELRRQYRNEYAEFIDASRYYPDVFQRMIDKIQLLIDITNPPLEEVLSQGHF